MPRHGLVEVDPLDAAAGIAAVKDHLPSIIISPAANRPAWRPGFGAREWWPAPRLATVLDMG